MKLKINWENMYEVRFFECVSLLYLFIAFFFSLPFKRKKVWLISERGYEARDNGYWFFLYMKENHPEINTKFIIDFKSKDFKRLDLYKDDLIDKDSFKHYVYMWIASYYISTHVMGCAPFNRRFYQKMKAKLGLFGSKKEVFLQHGIIKDDMPQFYYEETHLDMFVCGSKYEYDFIRDTFHYPNGEVRYTGLCRYDQLNDFKTKNQILIMPTWRQYIKDNEFEKSTYFAHYRELLTSPRFHKIAEDTNVDVVFYPHFEIQKFINLFKDLRLPRRFKIADFDYDVQTLLKESKMLITDFSSVYFDMAYMMKPILLYQFDEKEFREGHYKKGYLDVTNIGRRSENLNTLLDDLEFVINHNYVMEEKYLNYINGMFSMRDNHNCDRVYNNILSL